MYIFTRKFWSYSLERVIKTFAQVMIAALGANTFMPTSGNSWSKVLLEAGLASLISLLTAITAYSAASGTESTPTFLRQSKPATVPLFTSEGGK